MRNCNINSVCIFNFGVNCTLPSSYVVVASDLHPKYQRSATTNYADDTYLILGSRIIRTIAEEFGNIQSWAMKNNFQIHPSKTKE